MKRIVLLLLLLCAATQLHAQYAPVDSLGRDTRNQIEGRRLIRTGQSTLLAGGIATVALLFVWLYLLSLILITDAFVDRSLASSKGLSEE